VSEDHPHAQDPELAKSPRFEAERTRRDFLGRSAVWSAVAAGTAAGVGAMRLPMPAVFPESNPQVKIGPPEAFQIGQPTELRSLKLWMFRDEAGLYAISSVCTHLGCVVGRDAGTGAFQCPCHGSMFAADGAVTRGPAPKPLERPELTVSPDGQVVVDTQRFVPSGTRLVV